MDNIAIVGNPCVSVDKKISSDGSFKVAKMSKLENTPKIQTLAARWQKELAKIDSTVTKVVNSATNIMEKIGIVVTDYYEKLTNEGARKLKVNPIVANKTKSYYGTHNAIIIEKKKEELVQDSIPNTINDITIDEVRNDEQVADSRMSRLERNEETFVDNRNVEREMPVENKVTNTPITRFDRYSENPYDALINDSSNKQVEDEYESHTRVTETKGGDPNLYNELIHGAKNSDVSSQLLDARNKLSNAQKEKAKAKAVNKSLEDEVMKLRETIAAIKREKQEKDEMELSNTLNMLEATKEEILGETRKYDNLQEELAELIRQRDSLLNGGSAYENSNYSRGRM